MSESSRTGVIRYSRKAGVFMPMLMCDKGDLWQEYSGEIETPINITPDFGVMKPRISYVISSSRVAQGYVVPTKVVWYFNDVQITFEGGVSTNSFNGETGHFKEIPYEKGVNEYFGIQILKNLVAASGGAGCVIRAVATVRVGNVSDEIQATYPISISKSVGNQKVVTIISGDNNFFAIREKGGSVILEAMARVGASEIASGLTYKWYKNSGGSWQAIDSQTKKRLTVDGSMVDTNGVFKVEVSQNGTLIGMDTQVVMDLSDPYDILPNPVPANETIEEGSGGKVTYTPILVKRGTSVKAKEMKFFFTFYDGAGVILNVGDNEVAKNVGEATEEMCSQADGDISYIIESEH